MKTFEQYLQEMHAEQYIGTDDDMPDDFNNWLDQFDATAMMGLAESYGELIQGKKTFKEEYEETRMK